MSRLCSVKGCDKKCVARGLCRKHYMRWRKWGDPLVCHAHEPKGRLCSMPGCYRKHYGHGLCAHHLNNLKKRGDPLKDKSCPKNTVLKYKYFSTWTSWRGMLNRCYNANSAGYKNYGGRGIKVCPQWKDRDTGFETFLKDMGERPKERSSANRFLYSLDRINTDGDYCLENCRWATWKEQNRNRRTNALVEHHGEVHTLVEWSEKTGLPYKMLVQRRYYGWEEGRLFSPPQK